MRFAFPPYERNGWTWRRQAYFLRTGLLRITMTTERHVKLFKIVRTQVVEIPRGFEVPGDEVVMRKVGDKLIIEAAARHSLLDLLKTLRPTDETFPPIDDAGERP